MAVGGTKETMMITLAKASALTATAFTAAAVVVTLRVPEHGSGAAVPFYVTPAASQTAGQGSGPGRKDLVIAFETASGRWSCVPAGSRCRSS